MQSCQDSKCANERDFTLAYIGLHKDNIKYVGWRKKISKTYSFWCIRSLTPNSQKLSIIYVVLIIGIWNIMHGYRKVCFLSVNPVSMPVLYRNLQALVDQLVQAGSEDQDVEGVCTHVHVLP